MADLEGRVNGTVATSGFSAGLILSDDGSVQMFGSNSMTEGSVQELKVGMRVKCQVRKDRRRLFAYNIAVDHSFTPTYYGIVVPTHREQGLTVRDVLNDLHLNDELVGDIDYAIGSKLSFQLQDGGITNIDKNKTYKIKFSETDYDFSKFSTKTITNQKVQEIDSFILLSCTNGSQ